MELLTLDKRKSLAFSPFIILPQMCNVCPFISKDDLFYLKLIKPHEFLQLSRIHNTLCVCRLNSSLSCEFSSAVCPLAHSI